MTDESTTARCPICKKPTETAYRPFCSKRCADVDLHRWLVGSYSVPATETDEDEEMSEEAPRDSNDTNR